MLATSLAQVPRDAVQQPGPRQGARRHPRRGGDVRGGVDLSVVAAMLTDEGYDVVGVTMQLYDHGEATHRKGACCAGQDIHDARDVAARLRVPHYVLDLRAALPREGDRAVRARLCLRRDADSLRRLQPTYEIRRSLRRRAGPRRRPFGDRPLRRRAATTDAAGGRSTAPSIPSAIRATSCSPPPATSSGGCAFRWGRWRSPRCASLPAASAS